MDLFPIALPSETLQSVKLRLEPVRSDGMEPTLRGGRDFVLCKPTDRYEGEGIYLLDAHQGAGFPELYRCDGMAGLSSKGAIRLMRDNKAYGSAFVLTGDQFREVVLAIVVADVKVRAEHILRDAMGEPPGAGTL